LEHSAHTVKRAIRAVTLTEIIIGMGLLVVAFLAVAGIFSRNLQLQSRTQEMTEAAELGRRLLDSLRLDPRGIPDPPALFTPASSLLVGPPAFPPAPFPSIDGSFGRYDITVKVDSAADPSLKLVEVNVAWEDGQGVTLQTFFNR
jgi:type II secretory pathway pseudopilin PulG